MAISKKNIRIAVALLVSFGFMAAGYFFAPSLKTNIANATSTKALLEAYAAKDSDEDGLPDWKEALYGTDPKNANSVSASMTDSEAVAAGKVMPRFSTNTQTEKPVTAADIPGPAPKSGSLTERFAKQFFSQFLLSKQVGATPSAEEVQTFALDAVNELAAKNAVTDEFKESDLVRATGSGPAALQAYGAAMDAALHQPPTKLPKDELSYFNDYVISSDTTALKHVNELAKAYRATAVAAARVPVPDELRSHHLILVNATARLATAIEDFSVVDDDPMLAMLGLKEYTIATDQLAAEAKALEAVYTAAGVRFGKPYDLITP